MLCDICEATLDKMLHFFMCTHGKNIFPCVDTHTHTTSTGRGMRGIRGFDVEAATGVGSTSWTARTGPVTAPPEATGSCLVNKISADKIESKWKHEPYLKADDSEPRFSYHIHWQHLTAAQKWMFGAHFCSTTSFSFAGFFFRTAGALSRLTLSFVFAFLTACRAQYRVQLLNKLRII